VMLMFPLSELGRFACRTRDCLRLLESNVCLLQPRIDRYWLGAEKQLVAVPFIIRCLGSQKRGAFKRDLSSQAFC